MIASTTGRIRGKGARLDLGLALLSLLRKPGERLTLTDIAAWCGCPHQTIGRIEQRALRKLRAGLAAHPGATTPKPNP